MKRQQPGYILTLTLGLIMLALFISAYVYNKGFVFARFSTTVVEREKARQLAYGGIQLALAQLAVTAKPQQEKKSNEPAQSDSAALLQTIVPVLNREQKFKLKQAIDGINGSIALTVGAEEGKININRLYDFDKHQFIGQGQAKGDMRKLFQELFALIEQKIGKNLFADFETFLKEKKYSLNDVTELLTIKSFEVFKDLVFYDPSIANNEKIYLTDIFTVSSSKKEIEPWLLSHSLQTLLKFKSPATLAKDVVVKNFKEQVNWPKEWNTSLATLYGVEYNGIPKTIAEIFNNSFDSKIFSVISQATIGSVTVVFWAIIEREKSAKANSAPQMYIRKVYLL